MLSLLGEILLLKVTRTSPTFNRFGQPVYLDGETNPAESLALIPGPGSSCQWLECLPGSVDSQPCAAVYRPVVLILEEIIQDHANFQIYHSPIFVVGNGFMVLRTPSSKRGMKGSKTEMKQCWQLTRLPPAVRESWTGPLSALLCSKCLLVRLLMRSFRSLRLPARPIRPQHRRMQAQAFLLLRLVPPRLLILFLPRPRPLRFRRLLLLWLSSCLENPSPQGNRARGFPVFRFLQHQVLQLRARQLRFLLYSNQLQWFCCQNHKNGPGEAEEQNASQVSFEGRLCTEVHVITSTG